MIEDETLSGILMSDFASGIVGSMVSGLAIVFAAYIFRSGRSSLRRARLLTVEAALGDVGLSIRDLHRKARDEGNSTVFFSAKRSSTNLRHHTE